MKYLLFLLVISLPVQAYQPRLAKQVSERRAETLKEERREEKNITKNQPCDDCKENQRNISSEDEHRKVKK